VTYLLRKLNFIDAVIAKLMEKHEIEAIYLRDKPNIDAAKRQRRLHFAPELFEQ
jgi:predicted nucleic acid-binding protein